MPPPESGPPVGKAADFVGQLQQLVGRARATPPPASAAMAIPLLAAILGFCGWGIQLGSLAALNWNACANTLSGYDSKYIARCSTTNFALHW